VPWLEYISAPPGAPPLLARNQLIKTSRKPFKASVAMSEQFPMKVTNEMSNFVICPSRFIEFGYKLF
jgi:hypothetical protein